MLENTTLQTATLVSTEIYNKITTQYQLQLASPSRSPSHFLKSLFWNETERGEIVL